MAKKVKAYIKLIIKAGSANPSPPIGPALGQHGVPIMDFCKQFNEKSSNHEKGLPLPVVITVYEDRSFTFIIKTPPATTLIQKKLGLNKGSSTPGKETVATITWQDIKEIASDKMVDMNTSDLEAAMKTIAGSVRSMGVKVEPKAEEL